MKPDLSIESGLSLESAPLNRTKHGIDFVEAQDLWNDPMLLEIPAKTDEPRYLVIGLIDEKHWSAVITSAGSMSD